MVYVQYKISPWSVNDSMKMNDDSENKMKRSNERVCLMKIMYRQ